MSDDPPSRAGEGDNGADFAFRTIDPETGRSMRTIVQVKHHGAADDMSDRRGRLRDKANGFRSKDEPFRTKGGVSGTPDRSQSDPDDVHPVGAGSDAESAPTTEQRDSNLPQDSFADALAMAQQDVGRAIVKRDQLRAALLSARQTTRAVADEVAVLRSRNAPLADAEARLAEAEATEARLDEEHVSAIAAMLVAENRLRSLRATKGRADSDLADLTMSASGSVEGPKPRVGNGPVQSVGKAEGVAATVAVSDTLSTDDAVAAITERDTVETVEAEADTRPVQRQGGPYRQPSAVIRQGLHPVAAELLKDHPRLSQRAEADLNELVEDLWTHDVPAPVVTALARLQLHLLVDVLPWTLGESIEGLEVVFRAEAIHEAIAARVQDVLVDARHRARRSYVVGLKLLPFVAFVGAGLLAKGVPVALVALVVGGAALAVAAGAHAMQLFNQHVAELSRMISDLKARIPELQTPKRGLLPGERQ